MENLSEQERLSAATAIFGKPALAGGLAVLASLKNDEKYLEEQIANMRAQGVAEEKIAEYRIKTRNKLQDRLNRNMDAGGFAAQVATRMEDITGGSLRVMRSAIEDLSIAIGNALSPSIRDTAKNVTVLANFATGLVERFPVLSRVLFGGVAAALALGIAWKALGYAWTVSKAPFLSANTLLQSLRAQMALAALAAEGGPVKFGGLGNALRSLLPSIFAVNTALYANPIVWIGAAIAGAAVLIYKYWEPLGAFFSGLFQGIGQGFAAFAPVGDVFNAVADAVKGVWEWITQLFEPVRLTSDEFSALAESGRAVGEVIGAVLAGAGTPKRTSSFLRKLVRVLRNPCCAQPISCRPRIPSSARTSTISGPSPPATRRMVCPWNNWSARYAIRTGPCRCLFTAPFSAAGVCMVI
ncbi:MAG: phage tail tape measure protein [Desulfovibrio sp.]|jgi:hypothetical protein|nr:phage tail tape measure protein [Desulfovibrio sp.]